MTPFYQPGHFLIKTGTTTYTENIWVNLEGGIGIGPVTQSKIQNANGDWYHLITIHTVFNGSNDPFPHTWNQGFELTLDSKFTGVQIDLYNYEGTLYCSAIDRLEDAYTD